jgi:hypothetical protein
MDGTYGIENRGKWGGLVLLGKATNNLKVGNTSSAGVDGVGFIEGYLAADARNLYGMPLGQTDDNDNSGILKYVSVRHSGDIIAVGNELNGVSLGSVGRGTTIDHVEVVSCDDDGFEMFGGSVNLKYCSVLFSNDDMYDWDLGWVGKGQFLFGLKAPESIATTADNGFESDGDDNKSNALPRSHPQIFNSTLIGNADVTTNGDNSGICAIKAKEITEGEVYSSIFANWRNGFDLIKAPGSRTGGLESYHNWQTGFANSGSLIVSCNSFINTNNALTIANSVAALVAADNTKFTADGNTSALSLAGFDNTFAINGTTNVVTDKYDAVPEPAVASTCTPPNDGFFTPTNYRGAFETGKKSWLSDWAIQNIINCTQGVLPCPTDINADGLTNNVDFLLLLGQFNQSCQ